MKKFVLIGLSLLMSGCAFYQDQMDERKESIAILKPAPSVKKITTDLPRAKTSARAKTVQRFVSLDRVIVEAPVNLEITCSENHPRPSLYFSGPTMPINSYFDRSTLYIKQSVARVPSGELPTAHIEVPSLRQLSYNGIGTVHLCGTCSQLQQIKIAQSPAVTLEGRAIDLRRLHVSDAGVVRIVNLNTPDLSVTAHNTSLLRLEGNLKLRHVVFTGYGQLQAASIQTSRIDITARDKADVLLSGKTGLIGATLAGAAHLNARNLPAQRGFINTTNRAKAEVSVTESLNAFASENSNIYYYRHPRLLGRYMREQGSILYMGSPLRPCRTPDCAPTTKLPG